MGRLSKDEVDIVSVFFAVGTVDGNDTDKDVEERLALLSPSGLQIRFKVGDVGGMAGSHLLLYPLNGRWPAKSLSRDVRVVPAQEKPSFGRAEAATKDVVEGVEVSSPPAKSEGTGEGVIEAVEVVERGPVEHKLGKFRSVLFRLWRMHWEREQAMGLKVVAIVAHMKCAHGQPHRCIVDTAKIPKRFET